MEEFVVENNKAETETFWQLLSEDEGKLIISIPKIQRDYAQGRTDSNTKRIREKLIDDIFNTLINFKIDRQPLDLNFIYGNVETEFDQKGREKEKTFYPIDGQQRLTTLFLLHWYFALYSGQLQSNIEVKTRLLHFRYETRNVTEKFCRNLTNFVSVDLKNLVTQNLSDAISDYFWFFSDFEHDATVKSMLVMLDAIHSKTIEFLKHGKDKELQEFFDLLILPKEQAPLVFAFTNINDIGLTDNIYIKMNARGRPLTDFENFKAELRSFLDTESHFADRFIKELNGKWSNFFWAKEYRKEIKDKETGNLIREPYIDDQILNFFKYVMFYDYIINLDNKIVKNNHKTLRTALRSLSTEKTYITTNRLFKDGFKNVSDIHSDKAVIDIATFKTIERLLNIFCQRKLEKKLLKFTDYTDYNKSFLKENDTFIELLFSHENSQLNNIKKVLFYAEAYFLLKYSELTTFKFTYEKELARWLRLIYNLITPTLNLQDDILFGMLRTIHKQIDNGNAFECSNFMATLLPRNYTKEGMSVFADFQVKEESIKSILALKEKKWRDLIIESEQSFMDGQTGALFEFSGLTSLYDKEIVEFEKQNPDVDNLPDINTILKEADSNSEYYLKFKTYLNKFNRLFDSNGVRSELEENALLRRALLCFGGDDSFLLPHNKARQCFLDNSDRDLGFTRLLRDSNCGIRSFLKDLLDQIDLETPLIPQLNSIINKWDLSKGGRWKQYFIKMPEILCSVVNSPNPPKLTEDIIFNNPKRFIRKNNDDDILLLSRTQTNGMNRELYSYVIYLKALKEHLPVEYESNFTDKAEKYAQYVNRNKESVHVLYRKQKIGGEEGYYFIAEKEQDKSVLYYDKNLEIFFASLKKDMAEIS